MKLSTRSLTYEAPHLNVHDRLWNLILYISKLSARDPTYGKTKLAAILYFSDFTSFERYGEPVTGAKYIKLEKGPIPDMWSDLLKEMETSGAILIQTEPYYDYTQQRIVACREAELTQFSGRDIALVHDIMRRVASMSASEISEVSHDIKWKSAKLNEPIPYEASLLSDEPITQEDIDHVQKLIEEYGVDP
jgi:hypothetical protein